MTISPFLIYLWQLADSLKASCGFIGTLATLFGIGFAIASMIYSKGYIFSWERQKDKTEAEQQADMTFQMRASMRKVAKAILPVGVIGILVSILTPSSKTIAMMVIIPSIANSSVIQKDVPELYKFAVDALKAQLQEAAK